MYFIERNDILLKELFVFEKLAHFLSLWIWLFAIILFLLVIISSTWFYLNYYFVVVFVSFFLYSRGASANLEMNLIS